MKIPALEIPVIDYSEGVIIYGAGKTGKFVYDILKINGIKCIAVLDQNPCGFSGVPFYQFPNFPASFLNKPVILALHGAVWEAWENLNAADFCNVYTMSQFFLFIEYAQKRKIQNYAFLGGADEIPAHRQQIESVYNTLADERSREIFAAQLAYRLTGRYEYLLKPDTGFLYYPDNRPFSLPSSIVFVDCGAFDGDTLQDLMPLIDFKSIVAFEPDAKTFEKLCSFLEKVEFPGEILTFQAGVGEHNQVLSFSSAQDGGASFVQDGDIEVPVVSLDSLFTKFKVDFIKMDIEGSEAAALQGAKKIIRQHQPLLAISVYHTPNDLWELPALIKEINQEYSLFLRTHRGSYHDTVCYAVPEKFLRR